MTKNNVKTKIIKDQLGSANKMRIVAREVLWGIVEHLQETFELIEEQTPEYDYADHEVEGVGMPCDLPVQFGSNSMKNAAKRKRNQLTKKNKRNKASKQAIPIPQYDGTLLEHNIYRISPDFLKTVLPSTLPSKEENFISNSLFPQRHYVRVIGNSSSATAQNNSLVQLLTGDACMKDIIFEVERGVDLVELNASEIDTINELVEEDITRRFNLGCPEGVHLKYWDQRYRYLSKFDEGIVLDAESWFSITAEPIARYITQRCIQQSIQKKIPLDVVMDCFSGCGGNTIPFAYSARVNKVISIDFDAAKSAGLKHNAGVYGAAEKIETICGDVYAYLRSFLSETEQESVTRRLAKYYETDKSHKYFEFLNRNNKSGNIMPASAINSGISSNNNNNSSKNHVHFSDNDNHSDNGSEEEEVQPLLGNNSTSNSSNKSNSGNNGDSSNGNINKNISNNSKDNSSTGNNCNNGSNSSAESLHIEVENSSVVSSNNSVGVQLSQTTLSEPPITDTTRDTVTIATTTAATIATTTAATIATTIFNNTATPRPQLLVMSPPWGGMDYCTDGIAFDLCTMLPCGDGVLLSLLASTVAQNVVLLLPKNTKDEQIFDIQKVLNRACLIEDIYLNGSCKVKVVYFGPLFKMK